MKKYAPIPTVDLSDRRWPGRRIESAPEWCSVDLRDGNQALIEPMSTHEKLDMFRMLTRIGFKQIEVGFPSASITEYETTRMLIEQDMIPDDVEIQVLTQAREHLIRRTFEAIEGAKHAIVHLYTNTTPMFRQVVYRTDKQGLMDITTRESDLLLELAAKREDGGKGIRFEYSPEGFTETEPEFVLDVLERVINAFGATKDKPLIINLPSTVQKTSPNIYADRIEHVDRYLRGRESAIISVHPHNDRGTAVAEAEMALMAGAQRIEGTLFGNGERTGNVDLVTVALNMESEGINSGLDFHDISAIRQVYERSTRMHVHERSPYAGDLVFTAFSGSHQDAISKGLEYRSEHPGTIWQVPYLIMDPNDLGRSYEPIIRINSQSGKGGAAFVLQARFGFNLPSGMHAEFGAMVKHEAEKLGTELPPERLMHLFLREYSDVSSPYELIEHHINERGSHTASKVTFSGAIRRHGQIYELSGEGNGPIDAVFSAMQKVHLDGFTFKSYHEHAIGAGSDAKACAYIELSYHNRSVFGVGIHSNVSVASIKGVLSAVNRALRLSENAR